MTVKDLKAKLSNIPEEASVEIVMCANDNPPPARWVPSEQRVLL